MPIRRKYRDAAEAFGPCIGGWALDSVFDLGPELVRRAQLQYVQEFLRAAQRGITYIVGGTQVRPVEIAESGFILSVKTLQGQLMYTLSFCQNEKEEYFLMKGRKNRRITRGPSLRNLAKNK